MEVTRADLEAIKNDIKAHISDKLEPVIEDINGHKLTLYGKEGRNGLVGDAREMKVGVGIFKWLSTTGFLGMALKWWHG